jgi:DNA helicase-2/ATP-dependent DNA helicase PcrA
MAQYELVKLLVGQHRNLFVVADEDQSIYSWRGADYRNVLRFRDDFPEHRLILLEQNYRSTGTILNAAKHIIRKNQHRVRWLRSTMSKMKRALLSARLPG